MKKRKKKKGTFQSVLQTSLYFKIFCLGRLVPNNSLKIPLIALLQALLSSVLRTAIYQKSKILSFSQVYL